LQQKLLHRIAADNNIAMMILQQRLTNDRGDGV
jgi:hypothetical protein